MVGAANRAIGRAYIPAPTWRPIAELPERHPEWLDGRDVVVWVSGYHSVVAHHWDGDVWFAEFGGMIRPTHYLDLAIPEVPR